MLGPITPKVLTQTLRNMERDGLLMRRSFPVKPPHVEYELTTLGISVMELIDAIRQWSNSHLSELCDARVRHENQSSDSCLPSGGVKEDLPAEQLSE